MLKPGFVSGLHSFAFVHDYHCIKDTKNARNRLEIGRFVYIFVYKFRKSLKINVYCGERGIRTPGTSRYGSFQDCCNRPLYHLSVCLANLRRKRGMDKEFVGNLLKTFEDGMKSRGIAL